MWHSVCAFVLIVLSVFMIVLILIQRGKGGGLAGAFGGMGGQSAFGTKAGDTFTRITVVTAIIWFVLCAATVWSLKHSGYKGIGDSFSENIPAATTPANSQTSDSHSHSDSDSHSPASDSSTPIPVTVPESVPPTTPEQ
jgi:preprotein translocase subunit SecG